MKDQTMDTDTIDWGTTNRNKIQLNVGGKQFEVSPSLIKQSAPDSMLSRLISKDWNSDPTKPIFIDRDGEIFSHVLNYMRYGSIEIPNTLPLAMFERELDYYGIGISADESCIKQNTSIGTMKIIKQQIADAELHHDMLLIASTCHYKFMSGRTNVHIRSGDLDLKHNPYYYDKTEMMEILNDYLGKFYGLQASASKRLFASDLDLCLKVKELPTSLVKVVGRSHGTSACTSIRPPSRLGTRDDDGSITSIVSSLAGEALQLSPPRNSRGQHILSEHEFLHELERALSTP